MVALSCPWSAELRLIRKYPSSPHTDPKLFCTIQCASRPATPGPPHAAEPLARSPEHEGSKL